MPDRPNVTDPGRIVAHRGASLVAPENSLLAFRWAARQGVWWIEFDVTLLGDGTPVIHHDATLDRCTNRKGPLSALTAADLDGIDCGRGEPLPTLEQALDQIEELGIWANLEMKPHMEPAGRMAGIVAEALERRQWTRERVIVSSFSMGELDALRARMPAAPIAALFAQPPDNWPEIADRLGAAALHIGFDRLCSSVIAAARRRGIDVRTYTINDPVAAAPFRDAGLTGVITDHPPYFLDDADWRTWSNT